MSVFVGRSAELQQLRGALENALAGRGGSVFVKGEAGAGKSSLVQQFLLDAATAAPDLRILTGVSSEQFGAGEPYQPFVEAFRTLVQSQDAVAPAPGKRRLRDLAKQIAPYWLSVIPVAGNVIAAGAATASELRKAFGSGGSTGGSSSVPNEEALFFQYTELLFAVAAEQPVLLFLDDLHWADRASVGLLAHLGRRIADQRVLILGTYREADVVVGEHPLRQAKLELERYKAAKEIALAPLDTGALADFVRQELGAPGTPELLRWLATNAGATPLFFVELLRWLVEQGLVEEQRGEWALTRPPEQFDIPRTAESIIEKRLTRLDPDRYRIVEYASVFGSEFDSVSLAKLLPMDELELEDALEGIARTHQLIRLQDTRELPTGDFASIYEFGHSLIQHAVHKTLQGKRRILLHRKLAEILEATFSGDTSSVVRRLAMHFDEGKLPERAYVYAVQAADASARFYAHWSVIEVLQVALRNARTDEEKLEVLDRLGESYRLLGRLADALASFTDALELAERLGQPQRSLAIRRRMVLVEREHGARPPEDLLNQLRDLESEARNLGARAELCQILWQFRRFPGFLRFLDGGAARGVAREARELAVALGDPSMVAKADYELGVVLLMCGTPAEALPVFTQAAELYERLEDRDQLGMCLNVVGAARMMLGEYAPAVEAMSRAARIFDELGDPVNEASIRNNLAMLLIRTGDLPQALENLDEAVRIARRMDASARLLHPLQNRAELFQMQGDWARAREEWETLHALARDVAYPTAQVIARCGIGLCLLMGGDLVGALAARDEAAGLLGEDDGWSESREAWQMLAARIAAAQREHNRAVALLEDGEQALESRDPYLWAQFRLTRGELLSESAPEEARPLIQEAIDTFSRLGATSMRDHAEQVLSRAPREA